MFHRPVMVAEVIEALKIEFNPDAVVADLTLGGGGHAEAILAALSPRGRLIGIDRDREAVLSAQGRLGTDKRFGAFQAEFDRLPQIMESLRVHELDGVLMDLGVSSHQLDQAGRGFSFRQDGPLDMRMDQGREITAAKIVNEYPEEKLAEILFEFGEERRSRAIARALVRAREKKPIATTFELAGIVAGVVRRSGRIDPATRTFMAIRIALNSELDLLDAGLETAIKFLAPGARAVIISYHSLEDRIVKHAFVQAEIKSREQASEGDVEAARFRRVNKHVIKPSEQEKQSNPRARSARLRVLERLAPENN